VLTRKLVDQINKEYNVFIPRSSNAARHTGFFGRGDVHFRRPPRVKGLVERDSGSAHLLSAWRSTRK